MKAITSRGKRDGKQEIVQKGGEGCQREEGRAVMCKSGNINLLK